MKNVLFILNSQRLLDVKYFKISTPLLRNGYNLTPMKNMLKAVYQSYPMSNDAVRTQLLGHFHMAFHPGNTEFRG